MQLAEAEALSVLDDHDGGVRVVDADLDDGGGHQHRVDAGHEIPQNGRLFQRRLRTPGQGDVQSLQLSGFQLFKHGFRAAQVVRLLLPVLHQWTDHIGLAAFPDLVPEEAVHILPFAFRHQPSADRDASRRQFADDGQVQVAVEDQGQGPGNRGGGHDQHMRGQAFLRLSLLLQIGPLVYAEAVLLVSDDKAEMPVFHVPADQRVGAEHRLAGAAF